jgi:predicted RNA binding protein YcfA (HicA-like mRNA interferase family)
MPRNQREWIKALEDDGWVRERGGKHQVKMVKSGKRPMSCRSTEARPTARA